MDEVRLAAGELEAAFVPAAGMVGLSLHHRGDELLDRRRGLEAYVERNKTMGIPLLHPWANRLGGWDYEAEGRAVELPRDSPLVQAEENGLPIHGLLAAAKHWRVVAHERSHLRAEHDFAAQPELLALFPFPHVLELDVELSPEALTVTTTVRATGDVPVPISFGFHPYLRLPGVPRDRWELSLPERGAIETDERGIPCGAGEELPAERLTLAARAFDDGFDRIAEGATFAVAGGDREIAVRFVRGYTDAQVFSPPGAEFVCFEPMTAPANALRSGDGLRTTDGSFSATFAIAIA